MSPLLAGVRYHVQAMRAAIRNRATRKPAHAPPVTHFTFVIERLEPIRLLDGLLDDVGSTFPQEYFVPEGATVEASLHFINNSNDYIGATVDYADGSSREYYSSDPSFDEMTLAISHATLDNGPITVTATTQWWELGWPYIGTWQIADAYNVPPSATMQIDPGDAGEQRIVLANLADPSPVDLGSLHFSIAGTEEELADTYASALDPSSVVFDLQGDADGIIWARAFDKDGDRWDGNTQAIFPTINWMDVNGWTSTHTTSIAFQWLDLDGEDGYRIQRSLDGETFTTLINLPENHTTYTDTAVLPGRRYWYRVRAFGGGQDTPYSVKRAATAMPAGPANLRVLAGTGSATLTWDFADDPTCTLAVTGYEIYQRTDKGALQLIDTVASSTLTKTVNGLSNSSQYSFVVRALWSDAAITSDSIETPLYWVPPNDLPVDADFIYSGDAAKQKLVVTFGATPINLLTVDDFSLDNLETDSPVNFTLSQSGNVATLTFNVAAQSGKPAGVLLDGNYQLQVFPGVSDSTGRVLTQPYSYTFFWLAGDVNHDREVNSADLYTISANWNGTNKTFSQGDLNYDGSVNSADLTIYGNHQLARMPKPSPFYVWNYSNTQLNLSWEDNAFGEDGWWIQWSADGRSFNNTDRVSVPANTTFWADDGSQTSSIYPGTRRWYRVRAHGTGDAANTLYSSKKAGKSLTLGAELALTINALIAGRTASSTTMNLYSSANDGSGSYTRNTNLWTAGINLSFIPAWNSFQGALDNGVLVTPRHLIQAAHYGHLYPGDVGSMPPGTEVRFVDPTDNSVITAYVADNNPDDEHADPADTMNTGQKDDYYNGIVIPGTDILIIELESDVTGITPVKVFPSSVSGYLDGISGGFPVAFTRQDRDVRIGMWNSYYSAAAGIFPPSGSPYDSWYYSPRGGDSSSGVFAIIDNTPVALGTWLTAVSVANLSSNVSAINDAIGPNYQLDEYDLAGP